MTEKEMMNQMQNLLGIRKKPSEKEAAAIALATKAASSTVNAILAIIISVPLSALIRKALKSAHLTTK